MYSSLNVPVYIIINGVWYIIHVYMNIMPYAILFCFHIHSKASGKANVKEAFISVFSGGYSASVCKKSIISLKPFDHLQYWIHNGNTEFAIKNIVYRHMNVCM